jgi:hypothetical protein
MFTDKTMAARKSKRINELIARSVKDELSALYQEPTKEATATSMLNLHFITYNIYIEKGASPEC